MTRRLWRSSKLATPTGRPSVDRAVGDGLGSAVRQSLICSRSAPAASGRRRFDRSACIATPLAIRYDFFQSRSPSVDTVSCDEAADSEQAFE